MFKQTLMVSAVALGFVTGAFAGSLLEQPVPAPIAVGSDAGYYVGIEGGYGDTGWKDSAAIWQDNSSLLGFDYVSTTVKDSSWAGRVFAGYDFNKYFAIETGYTYFGDESLAKYTSSRTHVTLVYDKIRTQAIDLVGKIKAPLSDDFVIYAKLGPAYEMVHHKLYDNTKFNSNKLTAMFGAGVDYALTSNVVLNAEWLRLNGHQKHNSVYSLNKNYQPAADLYMVGIRYKWDM